MFKEDSLTIKLSKTGQTFNHTTPTIQHQTNLQPYHSNSTTPEKSFNHATPALQHHTKLQPYRYNSTTPDKPSAIPLM